MITYFIIAFAVWPVLAVIGAWVAKRVGEYLDEVDIFFIVSVAAIAAMIWPLVFPFAVIFFVCYLAFT